MELASKYDPKEVESKWYQYWLDNKLFSSKPDGREPYTVVIPPPNVTGVLHMGLDSRAWGHHPEAIAQAGMLMRLGSHGVYNGRDALEKRNPRFCRPLSQGPYLPRGKDGKLGPAGTNGSFG